MKGAGQGWEVGRERGGFFLPFSFFSFLFPSVLRHNKRWYSPEVIGFQLCRCDSQPEGQLGCSPKGGGHKRQPFQSWRQGMGRRSN